MLKLTEIWQDLFVIAVAQQLIKEYGAPFVNLLFDLFCEDFLMITTFLFDNFASDNLS